MLTSVELLDTLRQNQLLEQEQLTAVSSMLQAGTVANENLVDHLKERGWVTQLQMDYLLQGRVSELVLNGTYLLQEVLGEGGMGQVLKAKHLVLKSVRAIKIIRPECTASSYAVQRFHREIEMVAKLSHPNIVMAFDAGMANGMHYFVMEHVAGEDLTKVIIRHGKLPIQKAVDYVRQAALGLQHAHSCGLIHRDIKPSNLLLTQDTEIVKILDLGLARLRETKDDEQALTPTGIIMGTPDFMAPEQTLDAKSVDIRADIYALGCTLYQLLTGRFPFPGGDVVNKLIRHRQDEPEPVSNFRNDVSVELIAVLKKMMAKAADDRQQTPQEVADDLQPFLLEQPPIAKINQAPTLSEAAVGELCDTERPSKVIKQCPKCTATLKINVEHVGKNVRCTKCKHVFVIESGSSSAVNAAVPGQPIFDPAPSAKGSNPGESGTATDAKPPAGGTASEGATTDSWKPSEPPVPPPVPQPVKPVPAKPKQPQAPAAPIPQVVRPRATPQVAQKSQQQQPQRRAPTENNPPLAKGIPIVQPLPERPRHRPRPQRPRQRPPQPAQVVEPIASSNWNRFGILIVWLMVAAVVLGAGATVVHYEVYDLSEWIPFPSEGKVDDSDKTDGTGDDKKDGGKDRFETRPLPPRLRGRDKRS